VVNYPRRSSGPASAAVAGPEPGHDRRSYTPLSILLHRDDLVTPHELS